MNKLIFSIITLGFLICLTGYSYGQSLEKQGYRFCGVRAVVGSDSHYKPVYLPDVPICVGYDSVANPNNDRVSIGEAIALTHILYLQQETGNAAKNIAKLLTDLDQLGKDAKKLRQDMEDHKKELSNSIAKSFDNLPANLVKNEEFKSMIAQLKKSIMDEVDTKIK
jgi:hypothetical protein